MESYPAHSESIYTKQEINHISEVKIKSAVESLVEAGLVEAVGKGKSREYTLSAKVYQREKRVADYVRQKTIDEIRYPEMIISLAKINNGKVSRKDAADLLKINANQAYRILKKMVENGQLKLVGKGKTAAYIIIE